MTSTAALPIPDAPCKPILAWGIVRKVRSASGVLHASSSRHGGAGQTRLRGIGAGKVADFSQKDGMDFQKVADFSQKSGMYFSEKIGKTCKGIAYCDLGGA